MNHYRTAVIANPTSGGGDISRHWGRYSSILNSKIGKFTHWFTAKKGDGKRLAREAVDAGFEMVVAFGGDGTISEVVDGLFSDGMLVNPHIVLGVLHGGTGGDFRRTLGLPRTIEQAASTLSGTATRPIDVGRVRFHSSEGRQISRMFINVASFGISGLVNELVNAGSKRLGGPLSFGLATIRAMNLYRPQEVWVRFDAQASGECADSDGESGDNTERIFVHNIAIANGRFFGGGMKIAPDAAIDDGLFDVVTIGPMSWGDLLLRGHRIYSGQHITLPQVSVRHARRVDIHAIEPDCSLLIDVDGETPGVLPASFELLHRSLALKVSS